MLKTITQAYIEQLENDIQAYRAALGYSVSGEHDGRLSDGSFPICGLCEAREELRRNSMEIHESPTDNPRNEPL